MKKKRSVALILLTVILTLTSCANFGEWEYLLPNGYEMWYISANNIVIGYRRGSGLSVSEPEYKADGTREVRLIGIPAHVVEFCYNERYVCAKTIDPEDAEIYRKGKSVTTSYYILDTLEQTVYGPYSSEVSFMIKLIDLKVTDIGEWEKTSPPPEGAMHPGEMYRR